MRAASAQTTVPWIRSPLSIAATLIAGLHAVGSIVFIIYWNQQPHFDLEMFANYVVFFASGMLLAGIGASLFAPRKHRLMLIALNLLPIAWWLLI